MFIYYLLFDKDEIVQRVFLLQFLLLDFLHQILDVFVILRLRRDQRVVIFAKFIKIGSEERDQEFVGLIKLALRFSIETECDKSILL